MFNYFFGDEAKQFTFYAVPTLLFTDEKFKGLSCEAKLLYGILLSRVGLSSKKNWKDDENRLFVYLKRDEICELLGCKENKATKILSELDTKTGIGLIVRVKQGQGKPDRIYVCNFTKPSDEQTSENAGNPAKSENDFSFSKENFTKNGVENSALESDLDNKTTFKTVEKPLSKEWKNHCQDSEKTTHHIRYIEKDISSEIYQSINQSTETEKSTSEKSKNDDRLIDGYMQETEKYLQVVKANIGYDDYVDWIENFGTGYMSVKELDEIVGVIVRTICSKKQKEKICGQEFPREVVKSAMLKVDQTCIQNALEAMKKTDNIRNYEKFLISTLFNEANGRHFKENAENRWAEYAANRDFKETSYDLTDWDKRAAAFDPTTLIVDE